MMHSVAPATAAAPWRASLELEYVRRAERTVLAKRPHRGPLLVQRPFHPEPGGVCHTYVLHPPAGVVGGDRLRLAARLRRHAHALLTMPAATKLYRSTGRTARLFQHLTVDDEATLEWLPQEALVFDRARAAIATRIELAPAARFIGWEILCLGRPAGGPRFADGLLDVVLELWRNDAPVLLERLRLPHRRADAARGCGLRDHAASGTLIAVGAGAVERDTAREACATASCLAGASLIDDVLVCRALAADAAPVKSLFESVWRALRPSLLGRAAHPPRVWAT